VRSAHRDCFASLAMTAVWGNQERRYLHAVPPVAASVHDDAADRLSLSHQLEALVEVVEREGVGDQIVDVDLLLHVPVDDPRHVGAAAGAAEGGALPDSAGDQLERPRRNLLAGAGNADDDADPP